MMTQDQIAKLARKYAAESTEKAGLPNCLQNETFGLVATEAESVIRFLLRTHCIVSKNEAKEAEGDLRISVAKLRDILQQAAKDYNAPQYFIDEIINQVKKSI